MKFTHVKVQYCTNLFQLNFESQKPISNYLLKTVSQKSSIWEENPRCKSVDY